MGGSVSRESMFEGETCVTSSRAVIKVRYAGGYTEEFEGPIVAEEIMKKRARHWVAMPNIFKTSKPHLSILPPQGQLLPGQTYFLVPFHTVYRRMLRQSIPQQDLLCFLSQQGISLSKFHTELRSDPCCSSERSGHSLARATKKTNRKKIVSHGKHDFVSHYERRAPGDRDFPVLQKKTFINEKDQEETQNLLVIYCGHANHPKKVPTDQNSPGNLQKQHCHQVTHNPGGGTQHNAYNLHHNKSASHHQKRPSIGKAFSDGHVSQKLPLTDNNNKANNHEKAPEACLTSGQYGVPQEATFLQRKGSVKGSLSTRSGNQHSDYLDPVFLQMEDQENSPGGNRDAEIPIKRASDYYAKHSSPEVHRREPFTKRASDYYAKHSSPEVHRREPFTKRASDYYAKHSSPEVHRSEPFTEEPDKETNKDGGQENIVTKEPDKESNKDGEHLHILKYPEPDKESSKEMEKQVSGGDQNSVKDVEPHKEINKIQEVEAIGSDQENSTLQAFIGDLSTDKDVKPYKETNKIQEVQATGSHHENPTLLIDRKALFFIKEEETFQDTNIRNSPLEQPQHNETSKLELAPDSRQLEPQCNETLELQLARERRQLLTPAPSLQRSNPMQDQRMRPPFKQPPVLQRSKSMQELIQLRLPFVEPPLSQGNKSEQDQVALRPQLIQPHRLQKNKSLRDQTRLSRETYREQLQESHGTQDQTRLSTERYREQPPESHGTLRRNLTIERSLLQTASSKKQLTTREAVHHSPGSLGDLMLQSSIVMITHKDVQANMCNNTNYVNSGHGSMANLNDHQRSGATTRQLRRYIDLNQTPLNVNLRLPYSGDQQRQMMQQYAMLLPSSHGRLSKSRFRSGWKPTLQPVYEYASDSNIPQY